MLEVQLLPKQLDELVKHCCNHHQALLLVVVMMVLLYDRTIQRSFCLSVDMAHAVHPNYVSKHEKGHGPIMNGGMIIKRNANQRYATNGVTGLLMRELALKAKLPPI